LARDHAPAISRQDQPINLRRPPGAG
jgi:hypothetical protein